jgi:hypothetical protein
VPVPCEKVHRPPFLPRFAGALRFFGSLPDSLFDPLGFLRCLRLFGAPYPFRLGLKDGAGCHLGQLRCLRDNLMLGVGRRYCQCSCRNLGVEMLIDELVVDSEVRDVVPAVRVIIRVERTGCCRSFGGVMNDPERSGGVLPRAPGQGHPSCKRTSGHMLPPEICWIA